MNRHFTSLFFSLVFFSTLHVLAAAPDSVFVVKPKTTAAVPAQPITAAPVEFVDGLLPNADPIVFDDLADGAKALNKTGADELIDSFTDFVKGLDKGIDTEGLGKLKTRISKIKEFITKYPDVHAKLKSYPALRKKFLDDFLDAGDEVLTKLNKNGGELVEAWKVLDDLEETALRTDPNWLKRVNDWDAAGVKLSKNGSDLKLADASGNPLGEFKNGNLLPEKYATTGTPTGEVVNGYQVVDNNGTLALKRVPDKSAYSTSELTDLIQMHTYWKGMGMM